MINQEVKGTLAKLMATENLTVEHRQVSTAAFDVDRRILILPIWKTASNTVYDLLVGHEVGHALYTPPQDYPGVSKAFVNILEDARIEKMMKNTYPGLRKSFFEGYKELWDADFFGVKHEDPKKLSFIDRINLYYKGNPSMPFTDEEFTWVERIGNTKTFDDVINLARELWEYANSKEDEKDNMDLDMSSEESNQQPDDEVTPSSEGGDQDMTHEEMQEEAERRERNNEQGDTDSEMPLSQYGPTDETESITDAALKEALESLIDENAKEWIYLTLPTVDVEPYIVPYQQIQDDIMDYMNSQRGIQMYDSKLDYAIQHYNTFKKDAQKSVGYLVKQFEMKKSADEYKRSATAKTGVINTNSLYKYKITDDIFKKVTVVKEGKNHGLIMHVDWSGSMQYQLLDTLKQTYNLLWFAKKCGLPFRVYAFSSSWRDSTQTVKDQFNEFDLSIDNDFRLLELFSSKQNSKSLERSMLAVYLQAFAMGGYSMSYHSSYSLGGTPLVEAVLCTRQLVKNLKRTENVQKVNVIALTDGEANPISFLQSFPDDMTIHVDTKFRQRYLCHLHSKVIVLRDPITGYQRKISTSPYNTTKEIVSFFREITDYNWIGIRICSKNDLNRLIRDFDYKTIGSIEKQWRKERFASVKNDLGFTESFFMPDKYTGIGTQDLEVKTKNEVATKAELTRAFKKHMGSKMTNKTILNAFIEQIA